MRLEARLLSARTGLRDTACEKWMKHAGIDNIMDLRTRYPGKAHAECMELAIAEIESFICTADNPKSGPIDEALVNSLAPEPLRVQSRSR